MTITRTSIGLAAAACFTLALAGCSADHEEGSGSQTTASQFVACLTAAGVEAKVGDTGHVLVKTGSGDGSISSDSSGSGEGSLLTMGDSDGSVWNAPASSAYFADDPDTQDAYAACEQEFPDFTQPEYDPQDDPALQEYLAQQAEDGLTFARCARDSGFAWVADPAGEAGTTAGIALPADLTEEEFRALLEACFEPTMSLAWLIEGELGFDLSAVLEEFTGDAASGNSSTVIVGGDEE
ncbi:MAG: hypothetical protein QM675_05995 [Protaetiibacter sp.]